MQRKSEHTTCVLDVVCVYSTCSVVSNAKNQKITPHNTFVRHVEIISDNLDIVTQRQLLKLFRELYGQYVYWHALMWR